MIQLLLTAAVSGYAAAWLVQLAEFRSATDRERARSAILAGLAATLHVSGLLASWISYRTPPMVGVGPATATLALALVVGYFLASRRSERWSAGLLVLPLVVLMLSASLWAGLTPARPSAELRGPWLVGHILAVLGGYASLLLASVAAAMYLFQFRALKQKEFGNVFRFFPSLESLDRMNRVALAAGLSVLAVGLFVGWSLTLTFEREFSFADRDVSHGFLTWAAYAVALAARRPTDAFGPRAAVVSVAAFLTSGVTFLVFRSLGSSTEFFL
ncbi:MAG: cytochrome c biogenesis protein [Gemmatimonadetes bacterium]|nr:cytochrome c biogenesis protein [Gemmatimonadota bacterium]